MNIFIRSLRLVFRKYYPPFKNMHFWTIQILAVPIAIINLIIVNTGFVAQMPGLFFIPITLQAVPVIYAALNFGFAGSIGTAVWVVILSIPSLVLGPSGFELAGEIIQLLILVSMAIFIGQKVDRENKSHQKNVVAKAAFFSSEMKYRGLFDHSPLPVLLLDKNSLIIDANPAGVSLLKRDPGDLKGISANSLGIKGTPKWPFKSLNNNWWECETVTIINASSHRVLEPFYSRVIDLQGNEIIQVVLKDVTEEHLRQEGLKAYTAHMLRAQEEERQHIARELHDETIQTLAVLIRQLDSVESRCGALSLPFADEVAKARNIAEQAVSGLRDFTRALRPPILDDLGVVASIRRLVVDFNERTNVEAQFLLKGRERRFSKETETGIYRIAQEALWNVEHHACANNVEVTITFQENNVILKVGDDGVGFDVISVIGVKSVASRLGLVGMQERTEIFGGKLDIDSKPGQGTTITVYIPVPRDERQVS
jgi:signal transduction histidine kinase